jgi:hypothetical protein
LKLKFETYRGGGWDVWNLANYSFYHNPDYSHFKDQNVQQIQINTIKKQKGRSYVCELNLWGIGWGLVLGWKEINDTPHFYSLPQGERRIERISPSPYPLPRGGEGRRKMKRF